MFADLERRQLSSSSFGIPELFTSKSVMRGGGTILRQTWESLLCQGFRRQCLTFCHCNIEGILIPLLQPKFEVINKCLHSNFSALYAKPVQETFPNPKLC